MLLVARMGTDGSSVVHDRSAARPVEPHLAFGRPHASMPLIPVRGAGVDVAGVVVPAAGGCGDRATAPPPPRAGSVDDAFARLGVAPLEDDGTPMYAAVLLLLERIVVNQEGKYAGRAFDPRSYEMLITTYSADVLEGLEDAEFLDCMAVSCLLAPH